MDHRIDSDRTFPMKTEQWESLVGRLADSVSESLVRYRQDRRADQGQFAETGNWGYRRGAIRAVRQEA
jgi:hypothetical protein